MEDKTFVWTSDLITRLLELRFINDCLFKKKKQPWREFRKILLDNGFPEEMTVSHVRKKWSYCYDMYKLAKRTKSSSWTYFNMFDKHFAKSKMLDKYESWSDEWRLRLIKCMSEAKEMKLEFLKMWRTVESAMRSQDLPNDCCVQDLKGLWQHIRTTFNRKHRLKIKKGAALTDWPLYDAMIKYYEVYEPGYLHNLETEIANNYMSRKRNKGKYCKKKRDTDRNDNESDEFQWSRHITEAFIQVRLQNDWIFKQRKWGWNDLRAIMIDEYGFPETLTSREISRKWASTFAEYQKSKATNNKAWVYYSLFELYLGDRILSLNPVIGWQEEWVFNLISARSDLEHLFKFSRDPHHGWREVEKRLRNIGLPLDHSLLELSEIWTYLLKTFKWKRKFLNKGILNEQWPYYDAIARYVETEHRQPLRKHTQEEQEQEQEPDEDTANDDDLEDDIKLMDLKQMLQARPKYEAVDLNQCRTCYSEHGNIDIFEERADGDPNLADKLKLVSGVEVEKSDNMPSQICFNCLRDLDVAYKFRRKCQEIDKQLRCTGMREIKLEKKDEDAKHNVDSTKNEPERTDSDDMDAHYDDSEPVENITREVQSPVKIETQDVVQKRRKVRKEKYDYWKICEVCGKHTRNLVSHLDMHVSGKRYSCNLCDKKFKFKSGLVIHKAIHDPTPRKTCEVCGKTFHILAQYRRHFVYHANERKYECETCGKRFNTMDILKVHNRMHTDERPFSCQECGKTFRTAGCVSRHKKIVHKNIKVK
ncbi:uncharacterized protein LOC131843980 [Achroia grisella]|uniref:uncharacterized protein LOC131843980 n=1 Tax=Achroia grisella TaxID=688607 RepID=UPI0027D28149|nr:uncharacterized protein LOC131843980 [Achroia grisella]